MAAEDWHYVGTAGEPAFESPWENAGTISPLAYQLLMAGEVRLYGAFLCNGTASPEVFTVDDAGVVNVAGADTGDTVFVNGSYPVHPPANA